MQEKLEKMITYITNLVTFSNVFFFRSSEETLITQWLFFRYMAIGVYVGIATVGGAAYWFLYDTTGPQMSYYQLSNFLQCPAEPEKFKGLSCDIFQVKNLQCFVLALRSFKFFYVGRNAFSLT